jgi:3-oxoacyl-[acyl-carrier protein] reductase
MNLDLTGYNAFVGGSSKGIGWATAFELALLGASVTLVSRSEELLKKRIAELPTAQGQKHYFVCVDYADLVAVKTAADQISAERSIHILVNNTGGPAGGEIINESTEKFEAVFRQHLSVNQILMQTFLPGMKNAGFGRIVNVISVSVKQPIVGLGVSNTIRWAVASWAKTLSKEIARDGITVNNVLPGYTKTGRLDEVIKSQAESQGTTPAKVQQNMLSNVPTGKFATPEEVAAAVAFLCSPIAAPINGINIPVDGGLSAGL